MTIRRAALADLDAVTAIYNDAVLTTTATFDTEPKMQSEQKQWFEHHSDQFPILVAELDGVVLGWVSLSPWSDRCAYARIAEASLYIHKDYRGKGIGRRLLAALLKAGRKAGLHTVIGKVAEGNDVSLKLLRSLGFSHVGTMREVGVKFGKRLDVHLMQVMLDTAPPV